MSLEPPTKEEALRFVAAGLVRRFAEPNLSQEEAETSVRRLSDFCVALNYPADLFDWFDLDAIVRDRFSHVAQAEWMQMVRNVARSHSQAASSV